MANSMDLFDAYFKRADLDGDGQISGAEAVAFFQGSGLPKQVLAQVWMHADQRKASYLSRQEFYNALKLVTVAQSKRELTPDIVKAALSGPASAKIPAPQINLAATPAPKVVSPAPQSIGSVSVASQTIGARPPQVPANASSNQPYFPPQQNQFARLPQSIPPTSASHPQQVLTSQVMHKAATIAASLPPSSNISTDWLGGGTAGLTSHIFSRGVSPPAGMTASGFLPSAQPRPPATIGQTPSTPPEHQDAAVTSNRPAPKDSNTKTVSGNGFATDSLFGDVFSATPAQLKPNSSSTSSASSLPVSSAIVPSSSGSQPSVKPGLLNSSQSTFSQQHVGGQATGRADQQVATQNSSPSTGFDVGAANSASGQSQFPWPRMTQSDMQKYMKVFMQVDSDKDGKITGEQARNLFLSWRLPREVLKQVWDLSDQDNDSMLSLREFSIALYLMERYREGRPLPATLPSTILSDQILLSVSSRPTALHGSGTWGPGSGMQPPLHMTSTRPPSAAAARPPRPPPVPHAEEKQPTRQKPKVPVLEKPLVDQLSQEEHDSLNSKFQEAEQADKKVEELEKEILASRQKIELYRAKMQELILYKSRCDNRLNEVTARVSNDKHEAEALAKKYEEKYKQVEDVASKLTIEEATFRDIQERKMELYHAIVKMMEGGTADGVLKERAEHIQSGLEELIKTVNERCKQYGLRSKPTSLVELPFGWQNGIQEGAADWDEQWDKFEDEGFTFVKELTLDVQNVVAPPKPKSSSVQNEKTSTKGDLSPSSNAEAKANSIHGEATAEKESLHDQSENGAAQSPPDSPTATSATETQFHEFHKSAFRESTGADGSPHAKEIKSDTGGSDSVFSGGKSFDEPGWGTFDTHYDAESVWGFDSVSGKDMDNERCSESFLLGAGEFGLNPIRTGSSHVDDTVQGSPFVFADSVPSTPAAYNQGKSSLTYDSAPSTPAYNLGKSSFAFVDSVPSTPAYSQGKSPFTIADSIPSTPAYNFGNSPRRFSERSEDLSFDNFSRSDPFSMNDSGLFQSPSLARFDSICSTRDSDQNYGFQSRFDSFRESGDYDQSHGFSRFDSFRESDQSRGFSRYDLFRDSEPSHGFPSRFDSFRESIDSDHSLGFSRFDSFGSHDGQSFQSHGVSLARFDSVRGSGDSDNSHGFQTLDDTDPFGSGGPFKTSIDSETPRRTSDVWRAF